jgi:hypothetical protein
MVKVFIKRVKKGKNEGVLFGSVLFGRFKRLFVEGVTRFPDVFCQF